MSRLEEIRNKRLSEVTSLDLAWLYSRVEELEEENEALAETRKLDAEENVRLWEENQRYKEALEEIVEYNTSKFPHASVSYLENIANQALAGDTE